MPKLNLTQAQLEALTQIVNRPQVSGQDAEFVVELKKALANPEVEEIGTPPKGTGEAPKM